MALTPSMKLFLLKEIKESANQSIVRIIVPNGHKGIQNAIANMMTSAALAVLFKIFFIGIEKNEVQISFCSI